MNMCRERERERERRQVRFGPVEVGGKEKIHLMIPFVLHSQ